VEAEIGQRYASGGLDAAFAWIREHIEPLFLKQEANLARRLKQAPKRQRSRRR
jgi:dsRNA-specific ribonuclease